MMSKTLAIFAVLAATVAAAPAADARWDGNYHGHHGNWRNHKWSSASASASVEPSATEEAAPAETSAAAAETSAAPVSAGNLAALSVPGSAFNGAASFYNTQSDSENDGYGGQGACGGQISENENIVALKQGGAWDNGANCGRTIVIRNTENGATVTATVRDSCSSCSSTINGSGNEGIDLPYDLWQQLDLTGTDSAGLLPVRWWFE